MAAGNKIPFPNGAAKVVALTDVQNREEWKRAFQNRCKDHRYYEIVEETLRNDFEHRYLRVEDPSGNIRAIQPVFFVRQNLVQGVPGKIRSVVDRIRKSFPRFLTMRVLMVGCAAGTGDLGTCNEKDEAWVANALQASLQTYARRNKASLVVLKDFRAISRRMPERARFFIWRQNGKIVAFSFCLVCGYAIYDECIGLDYSVALDLHLYFYTLRDIISWALQQRLKYYYSNPLNYEPKLHLDCELVPLDLYVMHTNPLLNPIFRRVIKYLGPTRHDPVLQRFPNADQL